MRSPQLPSSPAVEGSAAVNGHSDYVRALHDFQPTTGSTTCLSFSAGQVIRTLNKDDSGWWDGELDGKRGWFPSNYVEVLVGVRNGSRVSGLPIRTPSRMAGLVFRAAVGQVEVLMLSLLQSRSVSPTISRPTKARPRSSDASSSSVTSSSRASTRLSADGQFSSVLDSIHQAITLLQSAVDANRIAHFQPSTAWSVARVEPQPSRGRSLIRPSSPTRSVISSVRTVLSSSDCLTRESVALKTHPSLASSRKRILSALASLVNQARKASSPSNTAAQAAVDAKEMLELADQVVSHVRNFLEEAKRCGVKLVLPPPVPEGGGGEGRKGSLDSIRARVVGGMGLRGARSMGDLKSQKRPAVPPTSTMPRPQDLSPSLISSPFASPALGHSLNPSSSIIIRTPSALSTLLSAQHDALLSTIAAFIGHVHAHTRASHSSSYAQLIDLTRETIEKVREVLVVVEAVSSHRSLLSKGANAIGVVGGEEGKSTHSELEVLEGCRERLYVATTALVTAARVATSAPTAEGAQVEDEERRSLLASATAVLRGGGDCVGAVKLAIMQPGAVGEGEWELVLPNLERSKVVDGEKEGEVERVAESVAKVSFGEGEKEDTAVGSRAGKRANHTLSMLGRKATSLSCLRDMYEGVGDVAEGEEGEEEATEVEQARRGSEASITTARTVDEGGMATPMARHRTRDRSASASSSGNTTSDTVTSVGDISSPDPDLELMATPEMTPRATIPNETVSAASSAMSRGESSRTSESATSSRSARSRTSTNDTSPRTSISTTHTSHSHAHKTSGHAPALPSSSAVFSTQSGNASAPNLPSRASAQPRRPSSHDSPRSSRPGTSMSANGAGKEPLPTYLARDYEAREISFNGDGHVTGGTLRCLVERMTLHDTTIDPTFANTFFLTFRMFTTPLELAESLYKRFDIAPPRVLEPVELKRWSDSKLTPVRLRIYNLFKTWLEAYWQHDTDQVIVEGLLAFCRGRLASAMSSASIRLVDIIQKRVVAANATAAAANPGMVAPASPALSTFSNSSSLSLAHPPQHRGLTRMQSTERFRAGKILPSSQNQLYASTHSPNPTNPFGQTGPPPPAPILGRNLVPLLQSGPPPSFSITDIDPLELARQLTIMESRVYCAIRADELLGQEFSKKGGAAENVRAASTLSTRLTGWIAETILGEKDAKKRTGLLKYFIKLSDVSSRFGNPLLGAQADPPRRHDTQRCLALNNYNTLFAVLCALNSSTISRLKKTWDGLAPKYRTLLDSLRKATEHARNYAEYRSKIRNAVPPCLPFVGLFL